MASVVTSAAEYFRTLLASLARASCLNEQYASSLFKRQTRGHSNLWVLIQKFQKGAALFSELCFAKKPLVNVPPTTPHANPQKCAAAPCKGEVQNETKRVLAEGGASASTIGLLSAAQPAM